MGIISSHPTPRKCCDTRLDSSARAPSGGHSIWCARRLQLLLDQDADPQMTTAGDDCADKEKSKEEQGIKSSSSSHFAYSTSTNKPAADGHMTHQSLLLMNPVRDCLRSVKNEDCEQNETTKKTLTDRNM